MTNKLNHECTCNKENEKREKNHSHTHTHTPTHTRTQTIFKKKQPKNLPHIRHQYTVWAALYMYIHNQISI